jgi:cytosine/adenosine deaminase-related metal-dependent hydrolase
MKFVIFGCAATMSPAHGVIANAAVYVDGNSITAVQDRAAPPPAGFAAAPKIDQGGIIFPGLIELHNHLSYDALPMWRVPSLFKDRGKWQSNADYVARVSSPMKTIAKSNDAKLLSAVARYADTKCLLGGTTTTQGISLKGDNVQAYYHGAVRVVDDSTDKAMPKAHTRIPDVAASDWAKFNAELAKATCLLLHLSEGVDDPAHKVFLALQHGGQWAITGALAGIHCAGLYPEDFQVYHQKGGSMVWSPLSNLMLYGDTSKVAAARQAQVPIALGSDWSPTGSKNLLNELKVAKVANDVNDYGLSDQDIVAMATSVPAAIAKWDKAVGSLEPGKRADLILVKGNASDPYGALIKAKETDVRLVVIDGRPVIGAPDLMAALGAAGESIALGSETRIVDYGPNDPKVPPITFAETTAKLDDALASLPTLLQQPAHLAVHAAAMPAFRLALDEEHLGHEALRASLPYHGKPTGPGPKLAAHLKTVAATTPPVSLTRDPVSVADDAGYAALLQGQINIPAAIKDGLKAYYA